MIYYKTSLRYMTALLKLENILILTIMNTATQFINKVCKDGDILLVIHLLIKLLYMLASSRASLNFLMKDLESNKISNEYTLY